MFRYDDNFMDRSWKQTEAVKFFSYGIQQFIKNGCSTICITMICHYVDWQFTGFYAGKVKAVICV